MVRLVSLENDVIPMILPCYRAVRSHEIASACANSVQAYATSVKDTLSKFLQFSTMGDDSPSPTPTFEGRGREKSSKEEKNATEVRKSVGTSTSQKGGKKSLSSKDSASQGSSNVTLNAVALGPVIAEPSRVHLKA